METESHGGPQLAVTTETDLGVAMPFAATGAAGVFEVEEDDPPPHAANCNASINAASAVKHAFIKSLLGF
ncbi:MAG TPA: hypothetical protein VGM15_15035 [Burkholderiaceae bacterium]